jgi:DNA-binding Lrp family transcriptional regulator
VSGGFDFLLKVAVEDMRAYEQFIREELSKVKGIAKIESNFVMGSPKPFGRLPL